MGAKSLWCSHPNKFGQGSRACRACANRHGIIRRYGINLCRQCFREYACDIGFRKVVLASLSPENDDCSLKKKKGNCKGRFQRYYYNKITTTCKKFKYGGCRGNANNFVSRDECERTCHDKHRHTKNQPSDYHRCLPAPVVGHCKGYVTRYAYDQESHTCKKFIYGGCGGNENNFRSLHECKKNCLQ